MSFISNSYVFRLQRYYFLIKYAIFLRKIRFFYKNICSMYAGYALSFSETVVPSDAALLLYHTYWRSCLPCTALPYSRTAAYPQGVRHSMYCAFFLRVGTLRAQYSKCHSRHFFTLNAANTHFFYTKMHFFPKIFAYLHFL